MAATRIARLLAALALALAMPACTRHCIPKDLARSKDLIDLCATPGEHQAASLDNMQEVADEFRRRAAAQHPPGTRPYHFLALSSGGLNGAFGIGVLKGWTESGTRPTFDVVTGISTGALMATSAFLGPQYDDFLRDEVVGTKRRDFLRRRCLIGVLPGASLFTSRRLARRIEDAITPKILCEVAAAHRAGRRLYVATTNLDTRGLIIWDMGAIAARGTPESAALYRSLILASSSIPLAFPPVRIQLEIDGVRYDEHHVDGGVCDEVIFRAFMVSDLNRAAGVPGNMAPEGSTLHVISNGKLYSDPSCVRGLFQIVSASFGAVMSNKSRDEMYRIFLNCLETGVKFRSTEVPRDMEISATSTLSLSTEDQEKLYETGRRFGPRAMIGGEGWRDAPPGSDPVEQALPRAGTRFATGGGTAGSAHPETCPAGQTLAPPPTIRLDAVPLPDPPK